METPRDIINALGHEAIAVRLGINPRRVYNTRTAERLPPAWYAGLCVMAGRRLPFELFDFKGEFQKAGNE